MKGKLYVLATPLGNLGDLSPRAAQILKSVQIVAAEDTRRSRTLLAETGGRVKLVSFHAHSKPSRMDELIDALEAGKSIALVTDAGTPGISDPGGRLVQRAQAGGIETIAVPGPSAVVAALSVSGLPADRFTFLGFLPRKGRDRRRLLETVATSPLTVVVFESPGRLAALLDDLAEICGPQRRAVVARELTKMHEEVKPGTLAELGGYYRETGPKGEITIVIEGCSEGSADVSEDAIRERALELLAGGVSRRDVAARLARELNVSRNETYRVVSAL